MKVKPVTRNVCHVHDDDDRKLGAIRQIGHAYQSQPDGAPRDAWRDWPTAAAAIEALRDYAAAQSPAAEEVKGSRFDGLEID